MYYISTGVAFIQNVNSVAEEFLNGSGPRIFVYSERWALSLYQIYGIKPDDPRWQEIKNELAGPNGQNIVYSDEYTIIYKAPE